MGANYRLFGAETSPYSIKIRSFLRYKKLPFDWVEKGLASDEEFRALAKSEALPMLVSPKGAVSHDTSAIMAMLDAANAKPYAQPLDPACRVLALLLEKYADEWLNKAMFAFRWSSAKAAKAAASRQAESMFTGYEVSDLDAIEKSIAKSMSGRLKTLGITKKTEPVLKASFERFVTALNAHLEHHLCIFGGQPGFADFALAGQLNQLLKDEAPGSFIRENAPFVLAWCEFMETPRSGAPFRKFKDVKDTLLPVFAEVAKTYLPFAEANVESVAKKRKTINPEIDGETFKQSTQKQTAISFEALKAAFLAVSAAEDFTAFLTETGLKDALPPGEAEEETEAVSDAPETPEVSDDNLPPVPETVEEAISEAPVTAATEDGSEATTEETPQADAQEEKE